MSDHSVEIDVSSASSQELVCLESPSSPPSWLTGEFLEKHLQNHYNNSKIRVINHVVEPPKNYGNFASIIYRVTVTFDASTSNGLLSKNGVILNGTFSSTSKMT